MTVDLGICVAAFAPVTGIIVRDITANGCAPIKWDLERRWIIYEYAEAAPITKPWHYTADFFADNLKAGDVNCRDIARLSDETEDRCGELIKYRGIDQAKLFLLNPDLRGDCSNIKYNTPYCIKGYLEPLRAHNGLCGPPHNHATCVGTDQGRCCNSETWKCGDSAHDCAMGICYEGYCWGHKRYTTDGTCGSQNGDRKCAGKWGDCCNVEGMCGTGPDFCSSERCYSGNCEGKEVNDEDLPSVES